MIGGQFIVMAFGQSSTHPRDVRDVGLHLCFLFVLSMMMQNDEHSAMLKQFAVGNCGRGGKKCFFGQRKQE